MPIYEYKCKDPNCSWEMERVCSISEHREHIECPICGGISQQMIGPQAVHSDNPKWLDDNVRAQIQGDDNAKPIETRGEYERYCKANGIVVTDRRV